MVVFVVAALVGVVQRYARVVSKLSKLRICGEVSYKKREKIKKGAPTGAPRQGLSSVFVDNHFSNTSSGPMGTYGPSLTSSSTVPDSIDTRLCHCPAGMLMSVPPGTMSMASVIRPSAS